MPVYYGDEDVIDNLSIDQLDLMAISEHSYLLDYLEHNTLFDVHRIRLLLELGAKEAERLAMTLKDIEGE